MNETRSNSGRRHSARPNLLHSGPCLWAGMMMAIWAAVQPPSVAGQSRVPTISVETLADDLWVIRDGLGSGNVLLYDVPGGAYLVDAGAPESASAIIATVDSLAENPVRTVISTHYHEDHLGANAWYAVRGARIMGHELLAVEALRDTTIAEMRWERRRANPTSLPTVQVTGPSMIKSGQPDGGTIAAIQKLQPAHSRTDIAVLIPTANVLHAGDLIEVGAYPFIDWWAGGSLEGMIEEVGLIVSWAQGDQRIVPGHGPVIGAKELAEYQTMLVTIRDRARAAIGRGASEAEFLDSQPTREFDAERGGEDAGRQFASLVWYGLTRGD
ncbi:MAG: MBL fold metallo-hydrolase [marine benthic group bacterium]|nr:MBL fold metallo-hydrolase [Gemmatimonadota bacterium]MCL7963618.1 MBL fold metallo-hydrolase [Candidatus Carthagonibacter metallireducens]MCL7980959.1 MBL fold metallo-hydrolase [Gemmatimonadota bacterium]MCL7984365.1 MBL fold metallo-hydrolase [Gemmatimonadota bacterium]MCL7990038.1 MBL fold metallo-hydrolase [Gemmatimonadota bacterium]